MLSIFNQTFTPHPQITNSILKAEMPLYTYHDFEAVLTNIVCFEVQSSRQLSYSLSACPFPKGFVISTSEARFRRLFIFSNTLVRLLT